MSYFKKAYKQGLIDPPDFVVYNLLYEVIMGSMSYGVSTDRSDMDIYGITVPRRTTVFPHETGNYITHFDSIPKNFKVYQKHHVKSKDGKQEFDFCVTSIIDFFKKCMNGTPNMIDSLYVKRRFVTYTSQIGELIRENRKLFLSKKLWHSFKGYAYSQLNKMEIKEPNPDGKRFWMYEKFGYDVKFAYNVVRLIDEIEQILIEEDLDLQRSRRKLIYIRNGGWTKAEVINYFETKEMILEKVHHDSKLPHKPRIEEIRALLMKCLSMFFADEKLMTKNDNYYKLVLEEIGDKINQSLGI